MLLIIAQIRRSGFDCEEGQIVYSFLFLFSFCFIHIGLYLMHTFLDGRPKTCTGPDVSWRVVEVFICQTLIYSHYNSCNVAYLELNWLCYGCAHAIVSWQYNRFNMVCWELKHISYSSPVKRICVFEHSVMTNFNCACPAIQRGHGSGFLSEGSSWLIACMSEQRRFWRDCAAINIKFAWRGLFYIAFAIVWWQQVNVVP